MGSDAGDTDLGGMPLEHLPHDLLPHVLACDAAAAIQRSEYAPGRDTRRQRPRVNRNLHPRGYRRGANAPVFPNEIDDPPAAIALLDMRKRERCHFRSSEPAAEKNGKDRAIAQPTDRRDVGCAEQRLRLPLRQPVPHPDAGRFRAFHSAESPGPIPARASRCPLPPQPIFELPTF